MKFATFNYSIIVKTVDMSISSMIEKIKAKSPSPLTYD